MNSVAIVSTEKIIDIEIKVVFHLTSHPVTISDTRRELVYFDMQLNWD